MCGPAARTLTRAAERPASWFAMALVCIGKVVLGSVVSASTLVCEWLETGA